MLTVFLSVLFAIESHFFMAPGTPTSPFEGQPSFSNQHSIATGGDILVTSGSHECTTGAKVDPDQTRAYNAEATIEWMSLLYTPRWNLNILKKKNLIAPGSCPILVIILRVQQYR